MLRADLQEGDSAAQRQGPAGEGASLVPVQDSDVVRDGGAYYLVINNLGERCGRSRVAVAASGVAAADPPCRSSGVLL